MRLNSLVLCNFRQHVDTRIDFDTGLTGIIGHNGSGKTTVLEAVAYALYGADAIRGKKTDIRNNRLGATSRAQVKVELDFELGGHRYRVVRGLTMAELYLDGAAAPIANSITGVTDLLRRRLGMSLDEFFNTYFTGQKELSVMAAMGPSERAQFLSRVLGYEKLRAAQKLVRERRGLIAAEHAGLRAGMPDPDSVGRMLADAEARLDAAELRALAAAQRRVRAGERLDEITPRWESLQRERERLVKLDAELRVIRNEASAVARDTDRLARELAEIAVAREELERIHRDLTPLAEVLGAVQAQERLAREEGRRQALSSEERALAEDLARLRERREKIAGAPQLEEEARLELERRTDELRATETELEQKRTAWVRDRQEAETKRDALRKTYAELKAQAEQLEKLGRDGVCPTCARPLGEHYVTVTDLLEDQINTAWVDGNYYKGRLEQLREPPPDVKALDTQRRALFDAVGKLERRLARVQAAIREGLDLDRDLASKAQRHATLLQELAAIPGGYDAARHRQLRAELDRLQPLDARAARLSAQVEREGQVRREQERVTAQAAQVHARAEELARQRAGLAVSEETFAELRSAYESAAAELRAAELDAVAAEGEAAGARAALETAQQAQADVERLQAQLIVLQKQKRLHEELDRAYSEMRDDLNVQLRPEISEQASSFLSDLTDGRYSELELDDQYNVMVLEDGIPKPVISGGEEDLANLVLRLAISQMIAERAGQSFSLLVLDEIFGSLDESRRHNVVELLRRLQDRFEQVILITHIESVREGLDRVITVRYDEESGASRVEQEGSGGAQALLDAGEAAD